MTSNTKITALTELVLTGTPGEIAALVDIAARSGRLIHKTTPTRMGGNDRRQQIRLFLQPTP